ncbi:hypothetical protein LTR16_001687 [Cryomyces antarcticus]|uniref:Uncharacterized protein n=1 Tax=Cryomyces antarcticus TaxID=329879 RepID=A0ABR0M898_9PEZI|nr:hypothetical protein LTR39_001003 [Cryomyces antarcticus]KAK5019047.1 hypothetical protein LTR60_001256 [Cryomyces antarcticus]KAK5293304.1 hypothetical protein LTR16_001687 [Cryomyces antarcticus]
MASAIMVPFPRYTSHAEVASTDSSPATDQLLSSMQPGAPRPTTQEETVRTIIKNLDDHRAVVRANILTQARRLASLPPPPSTQQPFSPASTATVIASLSTTLPSDVSDPAIPPSPNTASAAAASPSLYSTTPPPPPAIAAARAAVRHLDAYDAVAAGARAPYTDSLARMQTAREGADARAARPQARPVEEGAGVAHGPAHAAAQAPMQGGGAGVYDASRDPRRRR